MSDLLEHLADVVDRAVVGCELDAGEAERPRRLVSSGSFHERVRPYLLPERVLAPGVPVDRADHAERIARGGKKNGDGAGLDQRPLVQRLVVVAIKRTRSPRRSTAFVTTLLEVLVPLSTKDVLSAPNTFAA